MYPIHLACTKRVKVTPRWAAETRNAREHYSGYLRNAYLNKDGRFELSTRIYTRICLINPQRRRAKNEIRLSDDSSYLFRFALPCQYLMVGSLHVVTDYKDVRR